MRKIVARAALVLRLAGARLCAVSCGAGTGPGLRKRFEAIEPARGDYADFVFERRILSDESGAGGGGC